jgi:lysophospholipase L1-like esterase
MSSFQRFALLAVATVALASTAIAPAAQAAPRASVLVVGDSLEELTGPHLSDYLPGIEVTVNAVGGSNTFEILDLFEESYDPSQSVIVFDGGTNDNPNYPEILEENLAKVAAQVGDRCMVVPTIHGYTVEGADNHGKNAVVHRFAASRPGTETPDWASAVNHDMALLEPDHLHPSPEGSERRAELIAQGILGCLAYEETAGVAAAPEEAEASASSAEVETVRLAPVGRLARREEAILAATASGLFREAAMLAVLRGLLPGS